MNGPKVETTQPPNSGPLADSLQGQLTCPKPSGEPMQK